MQQSQELIDIQEVADSFGKSLESIRKYKNFGIIRVSDKRGNKDLFDRDEIMSIRERLRELRLRGLSLAQIADQLDLARAENTNTAPPQTPMSGQAPPPEPGPMLVALQSESTQSAPNIAPTNSKISGCSTRAPAPSTLFNKFHSRCERSSSNNVGKCKNVLLTSAMSTGHGVSSSVARVVRTRCNSRSSSSALTE